MEPQADFRVWATDNAQPSSSVPAHVAAKAGAGLDPGAERAFHRRLLRAYFTENRTISDWDVLHDLADDVGVDRSALEAEVESAGPAITRQVIDEHNEAIGNGINAVPTAVIGGVLPVPGAQDVDSYETWINRLIEHRATEAAR